MRQPHLAHAHVHRKYATSAIQGLNNHRDKSKNRRCSEGFITICNQHHGYFLPFLRANSLQPHVYIEWYLYCTHVQRWVKLGSVRVVSISVVTCNLIKPTHRNCQFDEGPKGPMNEISKCDTGNIILHDITANS